MPRLSVENFLFASTDMELARYRILSSLKAYADGFNHNRLFPGLSELVELRSSLETLLAERTKFFGGPLRALKKLDLEHAEIEYEKADMSCPPIDPVAQLIEWALPAIAKTAAEGSLIYEFVDENLSIREVGSLPTYRDDGYVFIPDNHSSLLHILAYHVTVYEAGPDTYRTLTTRTIRVLDTSSVQMPPESIKLELILQHHELPNPATFICETDLDFGFIETILPAAKRKLVSIVAA